MSSMLNLFELRREYRSRPLTLQELAVNPFEQFSHWFKEAQHAEVLEPNAMILATASLQAKPSSRTVLLKKVDADGFIFFTHYDSRKALEIKENPFVSATFFWKELERQVIIEGRVEKISVEESEIYFSSRPRASQISAWASRQDQIIPSREYLDQEYMRLEKQFEGQEISLPPYWGGFRIIPYRFEFWQGRIHRLHDRFEYTWQYQQWVKNRLAP